LVVSLAVASIVVMAEIQGESLVSHGEDCHMLPMSLILDRS
jgi:hypothetical protein